jgi:hypothetical protein
MLNRLRRGLSFSNVIAMVALFVALGGSVYAASKINGKSIKKDSVPGNRIKSDSLKGKQIKEAKLAQVPSAAQADNATSADNATTADSAQPVAFAFINGDGTVDEGLSKGVTDANVTHFSNGQYCLADLDFTVRGGQVTTLYGGTGGTTGSFANDANNANCPDTQVLTFSPGGTGVDESFYVLLYG